MPRPSLHGAAPSVLLVDRDPVGVLPLRDALDHRGYEVAVTPGLASVRAVLSPLAHPRRRGSRVPPRAALIAPCLDGHETGLQAVRLLRVVSPKTGRVLMAEQVPAWIDEPILRWAFHAVMRPSVCIDELCHAIEHARTLAIGGHAATAHGWLPLPDDLTGREKEVVRLRVQRWTCAEIAKSLGVTVGCIKKHCRSARAKLGCARGESLAHALARWQRA